MLCFVMCVNYLHHNSHLKGTNYILEHFVADISSFEWHVDTPSGTTEGIDEHATVSGDVLKEQSDCTISILRHF